MTRCVKIQRLGYDLKVSFTPQFSDTLLSKWRLRKGNKTVCVCIKKKKKLEGCCLVDGVKNVRGEVQKRGHHNHLLHDHMTATDSPVLSGNRECARKDAGLGAWQTRWDRTLPLTSCVASRLGKWLHSPEPPLSHLYIKWETPLPILQSVREDETMYVKAPSLVPSTE